jgi:dipeptidyl aminopeptidase/acylaminoacyl peptidase
VNEEVRLLPEDVHAMSPLHFTFNPETSYEILVGGGEPRDWIRESNRFAKHLESQGCEVYYQALSDLNHYSLMFELETPEGFISKRIRKDLEVTHK